MRPHRTLHRKSRFNKQDVNVPHINCAIEYTKYKRLFTSHVSTCCRLNSLGSLATAGVTRGASNIQLHAGSSLRWLGHLDSANTKCKLMLIVLRCV
uniref:Ovule protein n=1 Tax=Mesocestoides corti TaxID=53468 RepID=A0A5K3FS51_MESCO